MESTTKDGPFCTFAYVIPFLSISAIVLTLNDKASKDPSWHSAPAMKAFLAESDPNVTPGFRLRLPLLIEQGTADSFVFEPIVAALVAKLRAAGSPVIYKVYSGDDHFQIIPDGNADKLLGDLSPLIPLYASSAIQILSRV